MSTKLRLAAALCAVAIPASALAGCGGMSDYTIASVDGHDITRADYDHWMRIGARTAGGPTGAVPRPPEFTACVQGKLQRLPRTSREEDAPSKAVLKDECRDEYEQLREQVMSLLLRYVWIAQEAGKQRIEISDTDVERAFAEQRKGSFPNDADYRRFLSNSGMTEDDLKTQVKVELTVQRLQEKITGTPEIGQAAIARFYDTHRRRFAQPETRRLRAILTKDRETAARARASIDAGQPFDAAARRFSVDLASKAHGGELGPLAKGQQEPALDHAVFDADRGKLIGPIRTKFGYYVFEVTAIIPPRQQTLQEASSTIMQVLQADARRRLVQRWSAGFEARYRSMTHCRDGYVISRCGLN